MSIDNKQLNWAMAIVAQAVAGVPYVEGIPGDAKTAIMQVFAEKLGRKFFQHILSQQVPEDVIGVPRIAKTTIAGKEYECVEYVQSRVMLEAIHGHTFVCLDELPHAKPAVQAANQEVWLNNTPPNAMVVALGNPADLATDYNEFAAPVVNRMCMLKWESMDDLWDHGMRTGEWLAPDFPVLPDNWDEYKIKWTNMVLEFKQDASGMKHFEVHSTYPTNDEQKSEPWCSKRSWENAAICLGAAESVGATKDTAMKILAGFVGEGPATEFMAWYESLGFPSAKSMFDNPKAMRLPRQFAPAHAIVRGVVAHSRNEISSANGEAGEVFEKAVDFLDELHLINPELASAARDSIISMKPRGYSEKLRNSKRVIESQNAAAAVSMN